MPRADGNSAFLSVVLRFHSFSVMWKFGLPSLARLGPPPFSPRSSIGPRRASPFARMHAYVHACQPSPFSSFVLPLPARLKAILSFCDLFFPPSHLDLQPSHHRNHPPFAGQQNHRQLCAITIRARSSDLPPLDIESETSRSPRTTRHLHRPGNTGRFNPGLRQLRF